MTERPKLTLIVSPGHAAESQRLSEQARSMAQQALSGWLEILADARTEAMALDELDLPAGIKDRIRRWAIETKAVAECVQTLRSRR